MSELRPTRPDILDCLANLSSDEVFTPPKIANAMLDLLPKELWSNPKARFCDPFTKSGIFLREIVKRLDKGLAGVIPDKEKRINHIFANQVFGIAITQLTAIFSRRTLYCNKDVTNERSTTKDVFKSSGGNIIYHPCKHTWVNGSCKVCGASRKTLSESKEVENYAYPFLHDEAIMKQAQELGFDVVIGNPPYQIDDGGNSASARPLYHLFVQRALNLNPRYLIMIIPSRWFSGGKGLDQFRDLMIADKRICVMHDFLDASECFGYGVEIKSGVCYFLWDCNYNGMCSIFTHKTDGTVSKSNRYLKIDNDEVFIRHVEAISILEKIGRTANNFSSIVSSRKPFGLSTNDFGHKQKDNDDVVLLQRGGKAYINKRLITKNASWIGKNKVFITKAYGASDMFPHQIINEPILGNAGECCNETYLVVGPFKSKDEAKNVVSYMKTRLFRFLVSLLKITQDATSKVYRFVPMQDFSKPWTDEELYKKYGLSEDEVAFIESMIKPMDDKEAK